VKWANPCEIFFKFHGINGKWGKLENCYYIVTRLRNTSIGTEGMGRSLKKVAGCRLQVPSLEFRVCWLFLVTVSVFSFFAGFCLFKKV